MATPTIVTRSSAKIVSAANPPKTNGIYKGTRPSVLEQIAASGFTDKQKAMLTEAVEEMDKKYELVRLDVHQHPHNGGKNFTFTTMEL